MTDESLMRRIVYEYPFFENYVEPQGALTLDPASHACFYYGMLAQQARERAGTGPESQMLVYEVGHTPPDWLVPRDAEIAKSVALIYALNSPDDFLKFRKEAWTQAQMLGVAINPDVFRVTPATKFN